WKPDDHANSHLRKEGGDRVDSWKGVVCYNENTWVFENGAETTDFSLDVDSKGALHAVFTDFGHYKHVVPFVRKGGCQAPVG
ncbi:hypothetical protein R3Q06_36610, partial [Rhodococcus erythropolis]|uniref:hypothetical protein n=1 Tax=Rhodococcus erythropolis TaxID=1833 RepID=UPI00294A0B73